jgi:hypothetical protein
VDAEIVWVQRGRRRLNRGRIVAEPIVQPCAQLRQREIGREVLSRISEDNAGVAVVVHRYSRLAVQCGTRGISTPAAALRTGARRA